MTPGDTGDMHDTGDPVHTSSETHVISDAWRQVFLNNGEEFLGKISPGKIFIALKTAFWWAQ
jgi:hypothetical protein